MTPNLQEPFDFEGEVTIRFIVEITTKNVYLNSHELKIEQILLKKGKKKLDSTFKLDSDNQMLIVSAQSDLVIRNEYELTIEFSGILNEEMVGFYRSSYRNEGEKR